MEDDDWLNDIPWKKYQADIEKKIDISDYSYSSSSKDHIYGKAKVYKDEYERSKRECMKAQAQARDNEIRALEAENVLDILTSGNEAYQRALIQQDPENIRYIKNPYVSIQIEAITADPECIDLIRNPAQETLDTYRIIK